MYIGYANYILNAKESKEKNVVYSLKGTYEYLDSLSFPLKKGNLMINKIEVCSNNKGCTPKTPHEKSNYLIRLKDESTNGKTYKNVNDGKYVLMNMKGEYNIDGIKSTIFLRIPRSGVIGVRIGLSKQESIKVTNNSNKLTKLGKEIENDVFKLLNGTQGNFRPKKMRPFKIANLAIFGLNLFNPTTGNRPEQRIYDFGDFVERLQYNLKTHSTNYEPTNSKSVVRANFKPITNDSLPSFGVTQWGMVDMVGVKNLESAVQLKENLLIAFGKLKNNIEFNNNEEIKKPVKRNGGCPPRNPAPDATGKCPDGHTALPTKKKNICCYKRKMNPKQIINAYATAGVNMPQYLRNVLQPPPPVLNNNGNPAKNKKTVVVPYYNSKTKKFMYKKSEFNMTKCTSFAKPQLITIAKQVGANPGRFKADICKSIMSKLSENAMKRRKNIRRKYIKFANRLYDKKAES